MGKFFAYPGISRRDFALKRSTEVVKAAFACGTAEDIIEYMINTDRFDDVVYGFGVTITKVGAGIDGCPLYILRHFASAGSAKEIMDSWYDDLDDMKI